MGCILSVRLSARIFDNNRTLTLRPLPAVLMPMAAGGTIDVIAKLLEAGAFIVLYIFIGFGPGFIGGVLLANRIFGRGNPLRMEKHEQAINQAFEHNKQWDPEDPRWKQ